MIKLATRIDVTDSFMQASHSALCETDSLLWVYIKIEFEIANCNARYKELFFESDNHLEIPASGSEMSVCDTYDDHVPFERDPSMIPILRSIWARPLMLNGMQMRVTRMHL